MVPGYLLGMAMSEESYNIYCAVYAVTHSFHEMFHHQMQFQQMGNGKEIVFSPSQVMSVLLDDTHHKQSDILNGSTGNQTKYFREFSKKQ
jgi:hypothetical protein